MENKVHALHQWLKKLRTYAHTSQLKIVLNYNIPKLNFLWNENFKPCSKVLVEDRNVMQHAKILSAKSYFQPQEMCNRE